MTAPSPEAAQAEEEARLVRRSADGDRAAFDLLARRHLGRCYRLALRMTGDHAVAEEIAQEAMLRAWRKIDRFDPGKARLATWLHRIVVNLAIDHRRASPVAQETLSEALPADGGADAPALIEAEQRRDALMAGIAALPDRQRLAVVLTYFGQEAGEDTARALGVSARAVEGLLRRGRRFLRDWLQAREV